MMTQTLTLTKAVFVCKILAFVTTTVPDNNQNISYLFDITFLLFYCSEILYIFFLLFVTRLKQRISNVTSQNRIFISGFTDKAEA